MKKTVIALIWSLLPVLAQAQEDNIFYLMPSFGQGLVFFKGQSSPVPGQLNICAVDNTLRFLGDEGEEMTSDDNASVARVVIDGVGFLHYKDAYYRLYPVTMDSGYAVLRKVTLKRENMQDSYGSMSKTTSSKQYRKMVADGISYDLSEAYDMSEKLFLFKGKNILPFNKKSLLGCFPASKAAIEGYLSAGHPIPVTPEEAAALFRAVNL